MGLLSGVIQGGLSGELGKGLLAGGLLGSLDEFVGELTGRNQARGARNDANRRADAEILERGRLLKEKRRREFQDAVSASNAAQNIRGNTSNQGGQTQSKARVQVKPIDDANLLGI